MDKKLKESICYYENCFFCLAFLIKSDFKKRALNNQK